MAATLRKKGFSAMGVLIQQLGFFTSLLLQLHGLIYVFALFKKYRDGKLLMYYTTKRAITPQKKLFYLQ